MEPITLEGIENEVDKANKERAIKAYDDAFTIYKATQEEAAKGELDKESNSHKRNVYGHLNTKIQDCLEDIDIDGLRFVTTIPEPIRPKTPLTEETYIQCLALASYVSTGKPKKRRYGEKELVEDLSLHIDPQLFKKAIVAMRARIIARYSDSDNLTTKTQDDKTSQLIIDHLTRLHPIEGLTDDFIVTKGDQLFDIVQQFNALKSFYPSLVKVNS